MTFKIPTEYETGFDFGFSAVDSEEPISIPPVTQTIDTTELSAPILESVDKLAVTVTDLASKFDDLASKITRLEALSIDGTNSADLDDYKALIEKDAKIQLKELESMILPLLVNLLKDESKEYIKWPNRGPIIRAQMEKILKITRGADSVA